MRIQFHRGDAGTVPGVLGTILRLAEEQPDHAAAKDLAKELTYRQLCDAAGAVGFRLTQLGIREGDRVALYLENSVDFVIAALGCLWVGAIFVPLAVGDPEARLKLILDDCDPAMVIESGADGHDRTVQGSLSQHASVDIFELIEPGIYQSPIQESSDRTAYAIYTSGTSGTPKGVLISGGAFSTAVFAAANALGLGRDTKALCVSPFHFDGSYATLFSTLVAGGSIVLRPRDALMFPRTFFEAIANETITYTSFSPSYLRLLCASGSLSTLASTKLKIIGLGGEAVSVGDVHALWAAAPGIRLFNRYGPTETTISVTNFELTPDLIAGGQVPIGLPHIGTTFHIIDTDGRVVEGADAIGELFVGGRQLMSGYLGEPALTAQVVLEDVIPGERVYKTGDLVFRDGAGCYVYFDRADRVIKRNGVRISLVELTQTVQGLPGIRSAVCSTFNESGHLGIVAFVVLDTDKTPLELQVAARERLPGTMIPDRFEVVDALPLTASNKVDEQSLLEFAGLRAAPRAGTTISASAGRH